MIKLLLLFHSLSLSLSPRPLKVYLCFRQGLAAVTAMVAESCGIEMQILESGMQIPLHGVTPTRQLTTNERASESSFDRFMACQASSESIRIRTGTGPKRTQYKSEEKELKERGRSISNKWIAIRLHAHHFQDKSYAFRA